MLRINCIRRRVHLFRELDSAMLRRMEKRIFVPLPGTEERREIMRLNFAKTAHGIHHSSNGRNALICKVDLNALADVRLIITTVP
jgi:SpoVK/Ycf46/Vps4 family AAA+-type ATPase